MSCTINERPLKDILPYVLPSCMGLPEEMAMDYGRRAYIEFARRSGGLFKTLVYDLQEGVMDYPLELPEGYKVNRVNSVAIDGNTKVSPTLDHNGNVCCGGSTNQNLSGNYSGGAMNGSYGYGPNSWLGSCGRYQFHVVGYECIILHNAPNKDRTNGIQVEVSIIPDQEVCGFDDDFFDRWVEGITAGVLAKAFLLPNTDWFNPQLAATNERKFGVEIQRARHKFDLNNSRGPMRMEAKRFV